MWEIISEEMTNEDGATYIAYGLCCGDYRIADFSSVMEETEALISLFNRHAVSPVHAKDVIENYFAAL